MRIDRIDDVAARGLRRRQLLKRSAGLAAVGGGLPWLIAACGGDDEGGSTGAAVSEQSQGEGGALVDDVLDYALASDEWPGDFGFVSMRLHEAVVDGDSVWFIRTDASDEAFAAEQGLVFAPKIAALDGNRLSGEMVLFDDGPAVLSSHPGRGDYTPAWRVLRGVWSGEPRRLESRDDVAAAEAAGELELEDAAAVINAAVVKWPGGMIGVDRELEEYLGGGQLIEAPDTSAGEVKFKLHECFPNSRYIVTDHSIEMAAEMTGTAHSPRLQGSPRGQGATGRTNVFMNGVDGHGPMGGQPSVFDSDAGDPEWSPYWDHFTYIWEDGVNPRVLRTERQIHAARDRGDLEEVPGTPDTDGEVFTVNCPVPVTAPATFSA